MGFQPLADFTAEAASHSSVVSVAEEVLFVILTCKTFQDTFFPPFWHSV